MKELDALSFDSRDHINTVECAQGIRHYFAGNPKPEVPPTVSGLRFALGYALAEKVMTIKKLFEEL